MTNIAAITHRGCKELLFQRMLMAVISSIVVQFFFMSCVILITNLSITAPLSWLQDTWAILTCFRMWCYFIVLAIVIILQGLVCSRNYLNAPPFAASRFAMFCNLLTPHNFMVGGLYLTIGIVLVWLHLSLEGGKRSSLTTHCNTINGNCLVEEYLFLILGGLWTGIYYFAKTNIFGLHKLQFSIIPQSIFTQIRRGISTLLPQAMTSAVWPSLYFFGLYYLIGTYLRGMAVSALFINVENDPLDKVSTLLNVSLILHCWMYATLFVLTMNTMHLLFQAYLTDWMPFEIGQSIYSTSTSAVTITLSEALIMDKVPIIQHLGYLDLVTFAQKQKHRRNTLFTLSQPGGHPYNWNNIVEKCLSLIRKFSEEINIVCTCKQQDTKLTTTIPTSYKPEQAYSYHMRNLSSPTVVTEHITTQQSTATGQIIFDLIKSKKQNFIAYLLSKPLIFYFFGTEHDSKIQHLMINGQPIIWAADAISSLAVASLTEDPYGIVQKDLSIIIETLLLLKQSLDKLYKMNMLARKPQHDDKDVKQMLTLLRSASRRSVYRIVNNFKDYINDLTLEQTVKDQLLNFLVCKE